MRVRLEADDVSAPQERSSFGRGRAAYRFNHRFASQANLSDKSMIKSALTTEFAKYLVAIRLGGTPVPIPNTLVKP